MPGRSDNLSGTSLGAPSNQLLDLLEGAPKRITSPTSASSSSSSTSKTSHTFKPLAVSAATPTEPRQPSNGSVANGKDASGTVKANGSHNQDPPAGPSTTSAIESSPALDALKRSLAADIAESLRGELVAAVRDQTNAQLLSSVQESLSTHLPVELEKLLRKPDLKDHLSRNIAQTILPAVQRTATEVVSKVLAPHFEETMQATTQRVEASIVSEMTSIRKSSLLDQSKALGDTASQTKQLVDQMAAVMSKLDYLTSRNAELERLVAHAVASGKTSLHASLLEEDSQPGSPQGKVLATPETLSRFPPRVDYSAVRAMLPERIAVIGGGPVGCLAALAFAQRGCKVDIYESRPDPRTSEAVARASQRSINLALSLRGITGLRSVTGLGLDLADLVLEEAVPMHSRMIHTAPNRSGDVSQISQAYGTKGEAINSVDRGRLNNILLEHASRHPGIDVHFEHRLQTLDFDHDSRGGKKKADGAATSGERVRLDFEHHPHGRGKSSTTRYAGLVIGCDGAHSSVRSAMGAMVRMTYSHEYIDNGYIELSIPARTPLGAGQRMRGDGKRGGHDAWQLDPHHLHIWPRHEFMLIALPNRDGSFTSTLFAPFSVFTELSSRNAILSFFKRHFPDAIPLIGADRLVEDVLSRRPSPLGSVKCNPYHYRDRAVLIGDAAHAMLPFYGQGLNCGFEDVRVLLETIDASHSLTDALESYTKTRHPDLLAINQLAQNNYTEMATRVVKTSYLWRKRLDTLLMAVLPASAWCSLYSMVTFSNISYAKVVRREQRQDRILRFSFATASAVSFAWGIHRTRAIWMPVANEASRVVGRLLS